MSSELDILFELGSSWFIDYYRNLKDDGIISKIINSYEEGSINVSDFEKTQIECIRKSMINYKDDIVNLNCICSQLRKWLCYSYESFSVLNEKISNLSFKMDEVNERFRRLQTRINNLKVLERKVYIFLKELIISPDQINNVIVGQLDSNYIDLLVKLKGKLSIINKDGFGKAKLGKEISSVYYSLKSIADKRIYDEFILLLENDSVNMFLYNSELHSRLVAKSELLGQLDEFGTEYTKLRNVFCDMVKSDLFRYTMGIFEELCSKREKDIQLTINSREYDKHYSLFQERQLIINKIYLDTEENLEKAICFLPRENYHIEEIYFFSQRIIYKAFMEIYEFSRQLFMSNNKEIMDHIFSDYLDKIVDLFHGVISNSNDSMGLSIIFCIFFKYKTLLEAKISVFDSGVNDCEVIYIYYTKQINMIYYLLENSILNHLNLLPLISSREFNKSQKINRLSHFYSTTRSLSEFFFVIIRILVEIEDGKNKQVRKLISKIQQSLAKWLKKNSNYLQSETNEFEMSCVYMINNVDVIISTFQDDDFTDIFGHMLNEYTQKYIEYRFRNTYIDIHEFLEHKPLVDDFIIQEIEEIANNFHNNWKKNIDMELQQTLTSFSSFDTSEEILRLLGTTIAIKYSQFIDIITKNNEYKEYVKEKIVNTDEILGYIQKCLYPLHH
ncbi:vacuolar sorting VPS52 suppressor of actin Sac2-family [Cryptosporidium bovis]|uniref:vacuolar sorting VPS52 suppressor of actin Sac2-family n=1 Tax=Cryptosporidium bovis TaxID=310047 RepID=UPI00351A47B4|nr:vacuolar sorting VPS52 suppressor of actin Sac2-family [Cryptosporidium bovis]